MGQRLVTRPERRATSRPVSAEVHPVSLSIFETEMGWFGLIGRRGRRRTYLDWTRLRGAGSCGRRPRVETIGGDAASTESDWNPKLRRKLQDFARGIPTDFSDVKLELGRTTPFRKRVIEATRKIRYGRTLAYGELAAKAGSPAAARAIGTVMATNRFPIIVPCHRVIASGGAIGGFSAPHGIELKRRLLDMEAAAR